jgi:leucine efflux protein
MFGVTDYWAYLIGCIVIILLPGPNSLYVAAVSAARGGRAGLAGAVGIWVGDQILMFAAIFGVASIMKAYPAVFTALRYAGGLYIAYLGLRMIIGALRSGSGDGAQAAIAENTHLAVFKKALIISLSNPKAILFFMAFFTQFVDPTYPHHWQTFLVLGTTVQVCSVIYLLALIFISARTAQALKSNRTVAKWLATGAGALFMAFGAKLAVAVEK